MSYPDVEDVSADVIAEYESTLEPLPEVREKVHYVDNGEMLASYIAFQEKRKEHKEKGLPEPEIPRFLCECLMKICHRTAYKYNFINYSYKEEMILDAIENCIKGINMFNYEKYSNIFSYYTTAAWHSFVRRIKFEEKEARIKGKIISDLDIDSIVTQEHDNGDFQAEFVEYMKSASDFRAAHDKHQFKTLSKEDKSDAVVLDDDEIRLQFE